MGSVLYSRRGAAGRFRGLWAAARRSVDRPAGGRRVGLTQPTFGSGQRAARRGRPGSAPHQRVARRRQASISEDFIELYNPEPVPVALGGLCLTDNPLGWPTRHHDRAAEFRRANRLRRCSSPMAMPRRARTTSTSGCPPRGASPCLNADLALIDRSCMARSSRCLEGRCPDGPSNITVLLDRPRPARRTPVRCAPAELTSTVTPAHRGDEQRLALRGVRAPISARPGAALNYPTRVLAAGPGLLGLRHRRPQTLPEPIRTRSLPPATAAGSRSISATHFQSATDLAELCSVPDQQSGRRRGLLPQRRRGGRFSMPAGTVDATTPWPPARSATRPGRGPSRSLRRDLWSRATMCFAVEVHQAAPNSSDVAFGLALDRADPSPTTRRRPRGASTKCWPTTPPSTERRR